MALFRRFGRSVTVVTTMHRAGYEEYGQRFLETFEQHWPQDYRLRVYTEGFSLAARSARLEELDLLQAVPDVVGFRNANAAYPLARGRLPDGRYDYRRDAVKFANKSFATAHAARTCRTRYLVWLDADTVTLKAVPPDLVASLLAGSFVAYFGRDSMHSETGFLAFDLASRHAAEFFDTVRGIYLSGEVFRLREWHDCEVFDAARTVLSAQKKIASRNLSPPGTTHPLVNSVLGEYLDHLKGPERKKAGQSKAADFLYFRGRPLPPRPANLEAGRYAQIPRLIEALKPRTIAEVGTWSGHRAVSMARAALRHADKVKYYGFDLFEAALAHDDAREKNVKPHFPLEMVDALLAKFAAENPDFEYSLTRGDTRESLPRMAVDFAFIDGGHSVETIGSDLGRLRDSRVILLDDYYEGGVDTARFGCNILVQSLPHWVLPGADPVAGGGTTRLVLVAGEPLLSEIRSALPQ